MNFFKKALVASAVVASFGAAADATVSSTALKLSAEGIADGLTATAQPLVFDVVVGTDTPAASTITLTFDNTIDLNGVSDGPVTNGVSAGVGTVGNNTAAGITFNYGTGSFTFDDVVVTDNDQSKGEKDTLSFKVNLGNALSAGSAFRISLGDNTASPIVTGVTVVTGAADLAYQSVDAADALIENGAGTVAVEVSQFTFGVKTEYSELIDRVLTTQFKGQAANTADDTAVFTYSNNEGLAAALTGVNVSAKVTGDFSNLVSGDFAVTTAQSAATDTAPATPLASAAGSAVLNVDEDEVTVTLASANSAVDGTNTAVSLEFSKTVGATIVSESGDIETTWTVTSTNGTSTPIKLATDADTGEWALDATIINVPYFPVGFTDTSSSIHFANESKADADVIVTAIDDNGVEYGPLNLSGVNGFADGIEANTVRKVSQSHIMSLLSVPAATKLSVTFNIDSDVGDVNAYAFSQKVGEGRQALVTSQQKGSDK